jgi:hypothetical protein
VSLKRPAKRHTIESLRALGYGIRLAPRDGVPSSYHYAIVRLDDPETALASGIQHKNCHKAVAYALDHATRFLEKMEERGAS